MRKHGYDAFDWTVIVTAPARLHVILERQFMLDMNTVVPRGYNVGGAAGGQPSREILAQMGPKERETKLVEMRALASRMHTTLAEKRAADPKFDTAFKTMKKKVALAREIAWKKLAETDPSFVAKQRERRSLAGKKSVESRRIRVAAGLPVGPRTLAARERRR